MERFFRFALLLFFIPFLFLGCGGSGVNDGADITAILSPEGGATGVALDVSVTAVFSDTVDELPEWASVFTLKKDGVGDTLCTEVNYESSTNTATCVHAVLDTSSNYTASISGLSGVADATSTFTTASAPVISSMSKSSVSSAGAGNDITLTFTFAEAAPSGWASPVSVTDSEGAEVTVSGCEFGDDRTTYFCTVGGVAGCTTFSDYSVSVDDYTDRFNSADDEFDNNSTLATCWVETGRSNGGTANIADGTLNYELPLPSGTITHHKSISSGVDIAVLTYFASVVCPTGNGLMKPQVDAGFGLTGDTSVFFDVCSSWSIGSSMPGPGPGAVVGTEDFYSVIGSSPPLYICFVRHDDLIKMYLRSTGDSYTQLTSSNTTGGGWNAEALLSAIGASWVDKFSLPGLNGDDGYDSALTGSYGYVRFKTTGITGESSADCPSF